MTPPSPNHDVRNGWLAVLVIVAAVLIAYHNSFSGAFVFDDRKSILENPTIQQFSLAALSPPPGNLTVSGRPLLNVSFAINYALGGTNVKGYHVFNLVVHGLAALTLFGVVRRTLLTPRLRERFGAASLPLATAIAVLWAVHPVHTEAVTYIVQRAESLMGLFYLLTCYCFLRSVEANSMIWRALAILACLCGMATQEVMVTAPIIVLLYDRTFVAGSFVAALKQRRGLYLGLAGTWALLAWLVATGGSLGSESAGFSARISWQTYALTQFRVILYYLRLAVWPHPLIFDQGEVLLVDSPGKALPYAIVVLFLIAGAIISLWRRPALGFLGCWFFGILALTSSVLALNDPAWAHRMYLSLAAVIALLVAVAYSFAGRKSGAAFVAVAMALAALTVRRNEVYRTELALWTDTVAKCPGNARAHYNLANELFEAKRLQEAIAHYRIAIERKPLWLDARNNFGVILAFNNDLDGAIEQFTEVIRLAENSAGVYENLGNALLRKGRTAEAIAAYRRALEIDPGRGRARDGLQQALAAQPLPDPSVESRLEAVRAQPGSATAHNDLGTALLQSGRLEEALASYRKSIELKPDFAGARANLGVALAMLKRTAEAIEQLTEAVRLDPASAPTRSNLAGALEQGGFLNEAIQHYREAARLTPDRADAHFHLGRVLAVSGQKEEAVSELKRALELNPDHKGAKERLQALGGL